MTEKENSPLVSRLRKRKIVSYADMDMSLDKNDSVVEKIKPKKFARGSEGPDYSESDDDAFINSENEGELPEYELIRLKNIEERKRLFGELNIQGALSDFKAVTKVQKKKVPKKLKKISPTPPPLKKSLRLQNKSPSGEALPEKKKPVENVITSAVDYAVPRKPSGPLKLEDVLTPGFCDGVEEVKKCFELDIKKESSYEVENKLNCDLEDLRRNLSKMTLTCEKVVPHRIYSMAVHPSESRTLLAVGDKWGHLGLWCMQATGKDSIQVCEPHVGPVNCTNFCTYNPVKIYSTSHDGTVRCLDMNSLVFDEVYSSDNDLVRNHTTWHCQTEQSCLLIAHGNGNVALVDSRTARKAEGWYSCHERSVRTVQLHPLESEYFITSSSICEVKVWDRRYMNKKSPQAVSTLPHPKGLTSAFFSPSGKYILTTCNDDRLRVYDVREMKTTIPKVVANIRHNTHTGQWLTTFKATWHPRRDDVFIVGSMEHPRGILLYSNKGDRVHKLMDDNLASVCSICVFHPTQDIIFGGNSSGRVHVFT